jgi:HK97 family phage major capsid protein
MITLTVLPMLVVMAVALSKQGLDIYQINNWNVGTLKIEPWRQKRAAAVRAVAAFFRGDWLARLFRSRSFIAGIGLALMLLSTHLGVAHAHTSGLALIGVLGTTEPTLGEVKQAIEASNRLFEEFKVANDTRLAQIEKNGVADPLLQEKLAKLSAAIDKQSAINEAFMQMQAVVNRLEKFGPKDDPASRAAEAKLFNTSLRALATEYGRTVQKEVSADEIVAYKGALEVYMRRGERGLTAEQKASLFVGSDPQGGYLVTPDMSGRMITRIFETSEMRQYANVQTISTDALEGLFDIDEASFGWVAEQAARTTTNTPNVPIQWRIPVHEAYANPPVTQKFLEDGAIDVPQWIGKKVGNKLARGFNTAWVSGNGVGRPRGFNSYPTAATADTSRAWGTFEHVATGSSGSFGTDPNGVNKLLTLIHRMKDVYVGRGAFHMTRLTLGQIRTLTDNSTGTGKYVFIPSFTAGLPDTLLGYPVRKLQDMDDYTTANALAVAFGDMEETYQIVDRLGITILVDPYTNKPFVNFYTRARVGGDVLNFESLKFLKMA